MPSIFLSHSHIDRDVARQIYHLLTAQGIQVWLDEAEIKPGESIIAKIEDAIDQMEYLGLLISPASVASVWVLKELRMALMDEIMAKKLRVVGLLVADCTVPGFLREKKYIDCRQNLSSGVDALIRFLKGQSPDVPVPAQATLARIVDEADDELWERLSCGDASNKRSAANLIRALTAEQLEAALAVGHDWWNDQYKRYESKLIDSIEEYVDTDTQGARRLIRELLNGGLLDEATDLDYRGREQAYTQGDILWVIKRAAQRSGLFSRFSGIARNEV